MTGPQLAAFGTLVARQLDQGWRAARPTNSVLTGALVTKYYATGPPVQGESVIGDAGLAATDVALPYQCSVVMSYRTAFGGRSARGRNYLPYLAPVVGAADFTGDQVRLADAIAVDLANTYPVGLPLSTAGGAVNHELVVYSPTLGDAFTVTGVVVNTRIDTQRRRAGDT